MSRDPFIKIACIAVTLLFKLFEWQRNKFLGRFFSKHDIHHLYFAITPFVVTSLNRIVGAIVNLILRTISLPTYEEIFTAAVESV